MKTSSKSKIIFVLTAVAGLLFSCKENKQDGYSDEIDTMQYPADDTLTTATDTTGISGFSTTNKSDKGSSGVDDGGTGQGSGPGESAKDGSTYSGPSERTVKKSNTSAKTDSVSKGNK
jgi:hypothetical protein